MKKNLILCSLIFVMLAAVNPETRCLQREPGEKGKTISIKPDVVYGHKYGMALTFDMFQPKNSNGAAIIFINSGGFESGKLRQCEKTKSGDYKFLESNELYILQDKTAIPLLEQFSFSKFLSNGFTLFDVRHGSSPKFTLDEITEDVKTAVKHIINNSKKYNIDPKRIGLFGASAGGYLAIYYGVTQNNQPKSKPEQQTSDDYAIKTIAVYYPAGFDWIADKTRFPELFKNLPSLHIEDKILKSLSIKGHISKDDPSLLIIYGKQDFPFVVEASEKIFSGFQKLGINAKTIVFPNTGHEFRGKDGYNTEYGEKAVNETIAWFTKQLEKKLH